MRKKEYELVRNDSRGRLIQLVTAKFKQLNILEMTNNEPWGNHYHKNRYEFFHVLYGAVSVAIRRINTPVAVTTDFKEGDSFTIEPYKIHTITNTAEFSRLLVGYSKAFDPRNPDLHTEDVKPVNPMMKEEV